VRPQRVRRGARGSVVRVVQCLVLPGEPHPTKTNGRYDTATTRAVVGFQKRRGLEATGTVDRRTWTALLARGSTPYLKKGASGPQVRRLQRSLNVALGRRRVVVDGSYGVNTARAVRSYRTRLGIGREGIVTDRVWKALGRGRIS
jgi:peptidoglycan hydrolase-like protein with peptidoglycan-binding domain